MTSHDWRRLSARQGTEPEALLEGVPRHLYVPIVSWTALHSNADLLERAAVAARLPLPDINLQVQEYRYTAINAALDNLDYDPQEKLLDLVDAVLALRTTWHEDFSFGAVEELQPLLGLGGSVWRINAAGSGLERRVDKAIADTVEQSMKLADERYPSASAHLAEAWRFAYGRSPNASKVFSESIKAVEAAAAPIVTPKDLQATLGRIIGEMRKAPASWTAAIANANAEVAIDMMDTLWKGQTDRHGGVGPTVAVKSEAAEAALHLAATLVQWFSMGAITKN